MAVTSCSPTPATGKTDAISVVHPTPTATDSIQDGTYQHPLTVEPPLGACGENWQVTWEYGTQTWLLSCVSVHLPPFKVGRFISYQYGCYQIKHIDTVHHTMLAEEYDRQ